MPLLNSLEVLMWISMAPAFFPKGTLIFFSFFSTAQSYNWFLLAFADLLCRTSTLSNGQINRNGPQNLLPTGTVKESV